MLTLISLSFLKRLKVFKNEKLKNDLTPRAARRQGPSAAPPRPAAEPHGIKSLPRRAPRRRGLNAVGYDARCTFLENFDSIIYFSKVKPK
jgi:hypothetical protein